MTSLLIHGLQSGCCVKSCAMLLNGPTATSVILPGSEPADHQGACLGVAADGGDPPHIQLGANHSQRDREGIVDVGPYVAVEDDRDFLAALLRDTWPGKKCHGEADKCDAGKSSAKVAHGFLTDFKEQATG